MNKVEHHGGAEGLVCTQQLKHRAPKALGKQRFGHRRQRDERAPRAEHAVGGEHMRVRL